MRIDVIRARPTIDRDLHVVESLGKTQHLTPEGFLLCESVPIARTGMLEYGAEETGLEPGADGIVHVHRSADEVFKEDALKSFEGKTVTDDHPPVSVSPENFKRYVVGIARNIRRGEGAEADLVLADLLIHDKNAIEAVREGKREVSCGYDADYEQDEAGRGRQLNIRGNHVALVEKGRAGPRCSIKDRRPEVSKKPNVYLDALTRAFKSKDVKDLDAIAAELESGKTSDSTSVHVHLNAKDMAMPGGQGSTGQAEPSFEDKMNDSMSKMCDTLQKMSDKMFGKDTEEGEQEEKTTDEDYNDEEEEKSDTKDSAPRLAVLAPGMKFPTRDAKKKKNFKDAVTACKRTALDTALDAYNETLKPLLGKIDLDKASKPTIDGLFIAASELVKAKNNSAATRKTGDSGVDGLSGSLVTADDINAKARAHWATQGVKH